MTTTTNPVLTYESRDGTRYSGNTPLDIVEQLRQESAMSAEKTMAKFLSAAAARYAKFENVIVRADTAENFLHDLEAAGVLKRVMR